MRKAAYLLSLVSIGAGCIGADAIHAQTARRQAPTEPIAQTAKKPTPAESILLLEKGEDSVDIVDPVSLTIVARMYAGGRPHEVVASTDGKTAYMANENLKNNVGGRFGFSSYVSRETISVVDLVHQETLSPIDLGPFRAPHGVDYKDGKVYFTAQGARVIGRYNTVSQTIDWIMGTPGSGAHMIAITKDNKIIAISGGSVSIVDLVVNAPGGGRAGRGNAANGTNNGGATPGGGRAGGANGANNGAPDPTFNKVPDYGAPNPGLVTQSWRLTAIPVGQGSEGFDISPDGKLLITANKDNTISVIDLATEKLVETFHVDNANSANRIKFTLDGKYILESFLGRPEVLLLDAVTHKEIKRIPLKGPSEGLLMNPDGTKAYVTEDTMALLAEIDLKTMAVTREMKTGTDPDGLAWASRK